MTKSLFANVQDEVRLLDEYRAFRDAEPYEPARALMDIIFRRYPGPSTEFRNDFQTRGFTARTWELALFAWFLESRLEVAVPSDAPDFRVGNGSSEVAIEATTSNPPPGEDETTENALQRIQKAMEQGRAPLAPEDLVLSRDEQVFQLAKVIRRKVTKQDADGRHYWEHPAIEEVPFILAVMAYHERTALHFSSSPLVTYLYGVESHGVRRDDGSLDVVPVAVEEHVMGGKSIPSGFFRTDLGRNVAAVIFSNSATTSQFLRIGIEHEVVDYQHRVLRAGLCFDPNPDADSPRRFGYEVKPGQRRERFATGMQVVHNPWASLQADPSVLPGATHLYLREDGQVINEGPEFQPFRSETVVMQIASDEADQESAPF